MVEGWQKAKRFEGGNDKDNNNDHKIKTWFWWKIRCSWKGMMLVLVRLQQTLSREGLWCLCPALSAAQGCQSRVHSHWYFGESDPSIFSSIMSPKYCNSHCSGCFFFFPGLLCSHFPDIWSRMSSNGCLLWPSTTSLSLSNDNFSPEGWTEDFIKPMSPSLLALSF